jgi:putative SOS response-associated peptidase YedK
MCFKVEIHITRTEIENRFGRTMPESENFEPKYYFSAFEFPKLPVITTKEPNIVRSMDWGLIPSWVKKPEKAKELKFNTLNARAESLSEKPSFKHTLKTQRCLVICHGFFEWQHQGKNKIPYYIKLKDNLPFAIAGVFDNWENHTDGSVYTGFSLITCQANSLMAEIHNSKKRMPVILSKENEEAWIDINYATNKAINLLSPLDENLMEAWEIDDLNPESINSPLILERPSNKGNNQQLSLF